VERPFLHVVTGLIERIIHRVFSYVDMSISMVFDIFDNLSRISFQSIGIVDECFASGADFVICHKGHSDMIACCVEGKSSGV